MIKAAGTLAVTPLLLPGSLSGIGTAVRMNTGDQKVARFGDSRDWFFEKRYGMFVHWGLYSIPAWHEQHQWRARVPRSEYVKLASQWNPVKFNPEQWLDLMEEAGMKYITITTKHHDGFCLWCHKRNVPLCLYYSIADWNHPNYPNQGRHHELAGPEKGDQPDWDKYMEFLKAQVTELCSNYGKIDGFWWDMNVPLYKDTSVNSMIRKLQPSAVINNRGFDDGDFGTPERDFDATAAEAKTLDRATEACQSVGMESWGYKKDEDYYTDLHLIRSIDRYLARDANYLLNVGPTGEGLIPEESSAILKRLGKWHSSVKESFEGTEVSTKILTDKDAIVTVKGNILYVHFNKGIPGNGFKMKPINVLPESAVLLNDGRKIDCVVNLCPSDHLDQKPYLRLRNLPSNEMADSVMIVKLEFKNGLL